MSRNQNLPAARSLQQNFVITPCSGCRIQLQHPPHVPSIQCARCKAVTTIQNVTSLGCCQYCGSKNSYPQRAPGFKCYVCYFPTEVVEPPEQNLVDALAARFDRLSVVEYLGDLANSKQTLPAIDDVHLPTYTDGQDYVSSGTMIDIVEAALATQDYSHLVTVIQRVFSSPQSLNRSFLNSLPSTKFESGVDLPSLRTFYEKLLEMPKYVESALMEAMNKIFAPTNRIFEPEQIRQLLILLENPFLLRTEHHVELLPKLCSKIVSLGQPLILTFIHWLSRYKGSAEDIFLVIVNNLHKFLACRLFEMTKAKKPTHNDFKIVCVARTIGILNAANEIGNNIIFYTEFYNEAVNELIDMEKEYKNWINSLPGFTFFEYPCILSLASKNIVLKHEATVQMTREVQGAVLNSLFRGVVSSPYFGLRVRREYLIHDSLSQISGHTLELKKQLRVQFVGEEGIDAGGVKKEFFQLVVREVFDPKYGMFTYDKETRLFWFNSHSFESESEFELIGMILGLAIYNGVTLDLHFPFVVYKKLLEYPPDLNDLADLNPGLFTGLKKLQDYQNDDVDDVFALTFQVNSVVFDEIIHHNLKENGGNITVSKQNKAEYISLYIKFLLEESIQKQFSAFFKGFHTVCGGPALRLLRPVELELLICGSPNLDFSELEKCTTYQGGYDKTSRVIRDFWAVLQEYPVDMKKKFLWFATGSDRVPYKGAGNLNLLVSRSGPDSHRLPVAHTCFNHIELPEYSTKAKLLDRLSIAITGTEGFGLK